MKVLIACEFSGTVRDAFARLGHDAWSCDLLPSEAPGQHIQGDVLEHLGCGWDVLIAHPPCIFLSSSGMHWTTRGKRDPQRTVDALDFVRRLMDAPVPKIGVENPIGVISTRIRKPDQIIQPYQYGHDASKRTCLWLKNLPRLRPTGFVERGGWMASRGGPTRPTRGRTSSALPRTAGRSAVSRTPASRRRWLPSGVPCET